MEEKKRIFTRTLCVFFSLSLLLHASLPFRVARKQKPRPGPKAFALKSQNCFIFFQTPAFDNLARTGGYTNCFTTWIWPAIRSRSRCPCDVIFRPPFLASFSTTLIFSSCFKTERAMAPELFL